MSAPHSTEHQSPQTSPDPENPDENEEDTTTTAPKKSCSDPKLLFRRPPRKSLLRQTGMVLTKVDGSRHMHWDNPDKPDDRFVRRMVSRQSHLHEDASPRDKDVSDGPRTEVTELREDSEEDTYQSDSWSDSDEFYDTDLDLETTVAELFHGQATEDDRYSDDEEEKPADIIRLKDYEEACEAQNAIRQSIIARNLGNRDLDLRHSNIGSRNLKPLFIALKENVRVQRLLLDEAGLDDDGLESLANGLKDNVTISYLSLSGNSLGKKGVGHVVRLLFNNKTIQGLDLSDTKLGGDCILLLSHLLKGNSTLRFLDVSHNAFEEDQIRVLAAAIGENTGLEFLRLSWNKIRQSGAAAIGQCITTNAKLRVLDLSWNGLGYQGVVAIAASLKKNVTLQELDISQNGINWQSALILSRSIRKNAKLKILRMGGNPLTTTGAQDLVEGASSPLCNLRLLDISNVPVVFETEVLASSISQTRSFRLNHGGVVLIHDKIGRRLEPEKKPMERLLDHLRSRMIRPLELLREFDKDSSGNITQTDFMDRLRKANVQMHGFEIRALAASVSDLHFDGTKKINYKKLVDGVEHYIVKERMRKIRTRLYRQRVRDYHSQILSDNRPLYHHALSYTLDSARSGDRFSGSPLSSASPDRISRVSGKILYARESTRSLTLSLGKGSEKHFPQESGPGQHRFAMSAPLDEVGRKVKKKKAKKNTKKKKRQHHIHKEPPTLIGAMTASRNV